MDEYEASRPPRAVSTVERAYQLAREGPSTSLDDIRRQLEQERYGSVNAHLSGPTIRRQLRQLCRDRQVAGQRPAAEAISAE